MSAIRKKLTVIVALAAVSSSAFAFERTREALTPLHQDPVSASFQRMLTHEPNNIAPASPANFEHDPLIEAFALPALRRHVANRTQDRLASLRQDQVTASFQHMLTHEPNNLAPASPVNFERDPLIEALALPVLRWYADRPQTASQADGIAS